MTIEETARELVQRLRDAQGVVNRYGPATYILVNRRMARVLRQVLLDDSPVYVLRNGRRHKRQFHAK